MLRACPRPTSAGEPHARLNTGAEIPRVGLGVYQTPRGEATRAAVRAGIELGYRHIDTARAYGNEADVGAAVREAGRAARGAVRHDEAVEHRSGVRRRAPRVRWVARPAGPRVRRSLLLHWPVPGLRLESWRALEEIQASGRARAIGISNFMTHHLEELLARAKVVPAVNQIEVSPFLQQREVRALCAARGIVVEAYSPLTKGERLDHPVVRRIAGERGLSAAQVLLCWGLQRDLVPPVR